MSERAHSGEKSLQLQVGASLPPSPTDIPSNDIIIIIIIVIIIIISGSSNSNSITTIISRLTLGLLYEEESWSRV